MDAKTPGPASGTITGLKIQRGNKDRVNVYIDGEFLMGLPAIEAARLKVGLYLAAADIEKLRELDAGEKLYDQALRFLAFRPRSAKEVARYLHGKGAEESQIEAIISRLCTLGYLDDREFAHWWAENRSSFNPRGSYSIRQELRLKGVADEIVTEAIEKANPDRPHVIEALARKRAGRLQAEERPAFRRKLTSFLLRRGFSFEDISPIVGKLWLELEEERNRSNDG